MDNLATLPKNGPFGKVVQRYIVKFHPEVVKCDKVGELESVTKIANAMYAAGYMLSRLPAGAREEMLKDIQRYVDRTSRLGEVVEKQSN